MARRYSDIDRGPMLERAHTALQAYRNRDIATRNAGRQAGQRTQSPLVYVLIKPFGQTLTAPNDSYQCRTNQRNHSLMSGAIGNHATLPGNDSTFISSGNFNPAIVKLFVKTGSNPNAVSRATGIEYTRTLGSSHSHPFGSSATTDREYNVFNTIAEALRGTNANSRVTYSPEKISAER